MRYWLVVRKDTKGFIAGPWLKRLDAQLHCDAENETLLDIDPARRIIAEMLVGETPDEVQVRAYQKFVESHDKAAAVKSATEIAGLAQYPAQVIEQLVRLIDPFVEQVKRLEKRVESLERLCTD